jgi:hypothetical protein
LWYRVQHQLGASGHQLADEVPSGRFFSIYITVPAAPSAAPTKTEQTHYFAGTGSDVTTDGDGSNISQQGGQMKPSFMEFNWHYSKAVTSFFAKKSCLNAWLRPS